MKDSKYVWYACYGSNLLKDRFMCYINGQQIEGNSKPEQGCRDKNGPVDIRYYPINKKLYFGGSFSRWQDKGVAFLETEDSDAQTVGRIYMITKEQFHDLFLQENQHQVEPLLNMDDIFRKVKEQGFYDVEIDGYYNRILYLGEKDGMPVYSFTSSEHIEENFPSKQYLGIIEWGVRETVIGRYNDGQSAELFAKEYVEPFKEKSL